MKKVILLSLLIISNQAFTDSCPAGSWPLSCSAKGFVYQADGSLIEKDAICDGQHYRVDGQLVCISPN